MLSSSRLKRSSSLGRLASSDAASDDYRYKMAIEKLRCDLVGFPYCCNRHYSSYRRPPYYTDLDYPYYYRGYDRTYWPDWPYYSRRPWWYYEDGYYRDYVRGYEEGLKKYDGKLRRSTSSADLASVEKDVPSRAGAAEDNAAATSARALSSRTPPPAPPPPPPPPPPASSSYYYDRYYYPPYWNSYYYYRPPYYWRRYLDSRAY